MAKQKFSSAFKSIKVIGELPSDEIAKELRKMGDYYTAKKLEREYEEKESKGIYIRRYGDKVFGYHRYKKVTPYTYKKYKPKLKYEKVTRKAKSVVAKRVVYRADVSKAAPRRYRKEKVLIRKRKPWEYKYT